MIAIPFEAQQDPGSGRMCGAACLSMVYRSFGKEVGQTEIWPAIAKVNRFGSLASTTHLMAQDALRRGFSALIVGTRHPLQTLRLCHDAGVRVILNHRLKPDSATGHYTVMTDVDSEAVVVHDPYFGPSRRVSHVELQQLWQTVSLDSEIAGHVLIAITDRPMEVPACQFCDTVTPQGFECPHCRNPILLQPAAPLGCMNEDCIARMWNYICCPACDSLWKLGRSEEQPRSTHDPQSEGEPGPGPLAATEPVSLRQMFEQLEKFCSHINSAPGAAGHAGIQQQLQILTESKEKLNLALAEAAAYGQAHREKITAFVAKSDAAREAHRKKMNEADDKSAVVDGSLLGRALLKDLGIGV